MKKLNIDNGMNRLNVDKTNYKIITYFHKSWLNRIKNSLGSDCTYITHLNRTSGSKKGYYLVVHLKNETGGIDKVTYNLGTHPNNISSEDYEAFLKMLKNREYVRGSREVLSESNK